MTVLSFFIPLVSSLTDKTKEIPDVGHISRHMVLGTRVEELLSTHTPRCGNTLQGLSQVPPSSIKFLCCDGVIVHTPTILVNQITKGQEGNLKMCSTKIQTTMNNKEPDIKPKILDIFHEENTLSTCFISYVVTYDI